jgi:cytochrome c oxidase subunit 1
VRSDSPAFDLHHPEILQELPEARHGTTEPTPDTLGRQSD